MMLGARTGAWAKSDGGWQPTPNAFIETDGMASYMNLGFVPTANLEFELDFKMVSIVDTTFNYIQSCGSQRSSRYSIRFYRASSLYFVTAPSMSISNSIQKRVVVKYKIGELEFDGMKYDYSYDTSSLINNIILGSIVAPNNFYSNTRYYVAKYWDVVDGQRTLIRDLVPYSGTRGVGLLDLVNDVLYTNANTSGTLTYGEE